MSAAGEEKLRALSALIGVVAVCLWTTPAVGQPQTSLAVMLDEVLQETGSQGIAAAIVEDGKVIAVEARGIRNAAGAELDRNTVMYGASLTKSAFAYMVLLCCW